MKKESFQRHFRSRNWSKWVQWRSPQSNGQAMDCSSFKLFWSGSKGRLDNNIIMFNNNLFVTHCIISEMSLTFLLLYCHFHCHNFERTLRKFVVVEFASAHGHERSPRSSDLQGHLHPILHGEVQGRHQTVELALGERSSKHWCKNSFFSYTFLKMKSFSLFQAELWRRGMRLNVKNLVTKLSRLYSMEQMKEQMLIQFFTKDLTKTGSKESEEDFLLHGPALVLIRSGWSVSILISGEKHFNSTVTNVLY